MAAKKETPQKGRRPSDAIAGEGLTNAYLFKYKKEINRSMSKKYYAHTLEGKVPSELQPLEEHLRNVEEMARLFAEAFGAGGWGLSRGALA